VDYETKLEELRRLRKDAHGLGDGRKRSLADHAIVRRVHFIFQRATRKFRGDLALWAAWLQFCRDTGSARKLSQARMQISSQHASHSLPARPLVVYCATLPFHRC
jgi:U3 small nucleolar RNA-associated protein 6